MSNIAIVGGGPVGLWTACQIKSLAPEARVSVYEKYPHYKRAHPLVIRHNALAGAAGDERIQRVVQEFKAASPKGLIWKSSTISTKNIEARLLQLAREVGVVVHRGVSVSDCRSLGADIVIGTDGANSSVREAVFSENGALRSTLKRAVEVKYLVEGETRELPLHTKVRGMVATGALFDQHIGAMNEEGQTPVTLRLFVNRAGYDQMRGATYRSPYSLDQLPAEIRARAREWLALRGNRTGEVRVAGSVRVTATELGTRASEEFVKSEDGVKYCLVGDAAFAVPYFESLSNGLKCGSCLAKRISVGLKEGKLDAQLASYNRFVKTQRNWEILAAKVQTFLLQIAQGFVYLLSFLPIPLISASEQSCEQENERRQCVDAV